MVTAATRSINHAKRASKRYGASVLPSIKTDAPAIKSLESQDIMAFFASRVGGAAAAVILILTYAHLLLSATAHPLPATIITHPTAAFNISDLTLPVPANAPLIPVPSTTPPLLLDLASLRPLAHPEPLLSAAVTTALSEALAYISLHPASETFPTAEQQFPAKQTIVRFSMANFVQDEEFTFGQAGKCVGMLLEYLRESGEWRRAGAWVRREGKGGEGGEVVTFMQLGTTHRDGDGGVATT